MVIVLGSACSYGQQISNIRTKLFRIEGSSISIDTLGILPNTVKISGIASADFVMDYTGGKLYWLKVPPLKEVWITYRVLPFAVDPAVRRMAFDSVFFRFGITPQLLSGKKDAARPIDFGKLSSNGSIGRSLSFGNRQDAVLNSSLNLQLNGYMGDSVLINAAISDNNIPIQPDGNTQNLNEFDQVYIQFSKEKWKLSVGDLDIRQNQQYYLNFYKRLQGISYAATTQTGKQTRHEILASGAVAKGKFTRNVFQGIEGNQGPYRLKGASGELFFIVLAGTERVFIDGELMQRGEDQDYVINYNTAEITFMPKQMITKDKRIQIEFEYADRNYLNSQIYLNDKVSVGKKLIINAGYFSNTDARNSPINQTLDPDQKQFLSRLGNDVRNAFYPSAFADSFVQGKLLYRKVDTVYAAGKRDTVYVYAPGNTTDLYTLSFSDLGDGNGDYLLDPDRAANGKVYKWIAPDPVTGKKNGRYEPLILLVTPKKQSLFSLSAAWNASEKTQLLADVAMSVFDPNRYSAVNTENGNAGRIIINNKMVLDHSKEINLKTSLSAEYNSTGFKPLERLRTVEFTRDWGLDLVVTPSAERLLKGDFSLSSPKTGKLDYLIGNYARDQRFNAFRNQFTHVLDRDGWRLDNQLSWTNFEDDLQKGQFFRPSLSISKTVPSIQNREFSMKYAVERNETKWLSSQLLTPGSFSFSTFQLATQTNPEKLDKWGIKYFTRADALPQASTLLSTDRSHNFNINGEWMSHEHHQLRINATYRKLDFFDFTTSKKSEESVLGRVEYNTNLWEGAITGSTIYELGSGQEPRKDFTYFEVPAGQGEYAWIDYNADGIQQINEFEVARFRDQARFIRIFTPTSEFVRANYLNFNYNLVLDPSVAIKKDDVKGISGIIRRMYFQSSLQVTDRSMASEGRKLNPFRQQSADTSLIITERLQSHSFSFNRLSQVWGLDLNYLQNISKSFLSYGFESRSNRDVTMRIRSNWFKVITLEMIAKRGLNRLETPGFQNRNFEVSSTSFEPRLTFTYLTRLRLQVSYRTDDKRNTGIERAVIKGIQMEGKYNLVSNTSISSRFVLNNITFTGIPSTTLGYVMLEGLLPGRNLIWTTDITKRLGSFLEISIQYEGRRAAASGMVHLGRAQVRALL